MLPFQYKWASDFAEGRAVVVAPSGTYALIDKTGREILPAMYELMEWDAVHGVVKVSYEGVFGLAGSATERRSYRCNTTGWAIPTIR